MTQKDPIIYNFDTFNLTYSTNTQYVNNGKTTPNSYNIDLPIPQPLTGITKIKLLSLELPILFPNIRAPYMNQFEVNSHIFTIPEMNYTSISGLLSSLNSQGNLVNYSFQYAKIEITQTYSNTETQIAFNSWNFMYNNATVSYTNATATWTDASGNVTNVYVNKQPFTPNTENFISPSNSNPSGSYVINFGYLVTANMYNFVSANTTTDSDNGGRNPKYWSVYLSIDGINYTLADTETNCSIQNSTNSVTPNYNIYPSLTNYTFTTNSNNQVILTASNPSFTTFNIADTILAYMLGFRLNNLDSIVSNTIMSYSQYQLNVDSYLNMYIYNVSTQSNNAEQSLNSFKIPLNGTQGVVYYTSQYLSYDQACIVSPNYTINKLSVIILDRFGVAVNSYGGDWSATFLFSFD